MRLRVIAAFLLTITIVGAQTTYRRQSGARSTGGRDANDDRLFPTLRGTVKGIDKKGLLLEEDAGNDLPIRLNRKTEFWEAGKKLQASAIEIGALVTVDVRRFPDGSLDALTVRVMPPPKPRE